jgi:predicted transposase YdaD
MTKVGRLFEEEKLEYAKEREREREIARSLLADGIDILSILKATKLSKAEILKLKEEISA